VRRSIVLSQNFLRGGALVDRLLDRSTIGPDDLVFEIGPGKGRLTERLAMRCRRLVAVEKDPELAARLARRFADRPHVAIHAEDFLDFPLPRRPSDRYKVFASIPFNVTAAVVTKLVDASLPPDDSYLVVQREAALRFLGAPRESLSALLLKPWFEPALFHRFRRTDFDPVPGVDVVMMRLRKRGPPLVAAADAQLYRDFVVSAVTAWQPFLCSALSHVLGQRQSARLLRGVGVDVAASPTSVPFEHWLTLFERFRRDGGPEARKAVAGAEQHLRLTQRRLERVHRTRTRRGEMMPPAAGTVSSRGRRVVIRYV
jgi:23S rRNA (adenine-N6)-dimethyltransferase